MTNKNPKPQTEIMERFHFEIELDDDDARRVQVVLMPNDMTMKQFAEYSIVKVVEAQVGNEFDVVPRA